MSVKKFALATVAAAGFIFATLPARAETTTLIISSWLPNHFITKVLEEYGRDLEKASNGRIKYKLLPQPVAPPPGTFDAVKDGLADISWSVNGMNPGRFPLTAVGEIPLLGSTSEAVTVAYQHLYQDEILPKVNEYKGLKLVTVFSSGPGDVFTTKRAVKSLNDFSGLKVRVSGGSSEVVAKTLHMAGILKPVSENYELLSGGIVDGTMSGLDGIVAFKLDKILKYWTKSPGGLYRTTFAVVMNEKTYNRLSPEDQKLVDKFGGERLARKFAQAWDKSDLNSLKVIKANKITIVTPDDDVIKAIKDHGFEKPWLEAAKAAGLDGPALLKEFMENIKKAEAESK